MRKKAPHHRVYVIRLRNPRRGDRREAFYVGMTGLPIETRFANHKRGYKSAHVVTKYGVELAPDPGRAGVGREQQGGEHLPPPVERQRPQLPRRAGGDDPGGRPAGGRTQRRELVQRH